MITLAESDWVGRVTLAESDRADRVLLGRLREYFGRVTLAESENIFADLPWPNPNNMAESP